MPFKPTDFTQVNPHINRVLVARAAPAGRAAHERVIDWFCGLGNFTLPLATQAREVLGIEGSEALVARSRELRGNRPGGPQRRCPTGFVARNLFEMTPEMLVADGRPTAGWSIRRARAFALAKALADLHQQHCLARQPARRLERRRSASSMSAATPPRWRATPGCWCTRGYRCTAAGAVNMFPHTAHVESMAVFERGPAWD
jgi:23S rRNA (uracil1939-C5)-methyltransferase